MRLKPPLPRQTGRRRRSRRRRGPKSSFNASRKKRLRLRGVWPPQAARRGSLLLAALAGPKTPRAPHLTWPSKLLAKSGTDLVVAQQSTGSASQLAGEVIRRGLAVGERSPQRNRGLSRSLVSCSLERQPSLPSSPSQRILRYASAPSLAPFGFLDSFSAAPALRKELSNLASRKATPITPSSPRRVRGFLRDHGVKLAQHSLLRWSFFFSVCLPLIPPVLPPTSSAHTASSRYSVLPRACPASSRAPSPACRKATATRVPRRPPSKQECDDRRRRR
ncbi:hypothetical protein BJY59DRAFT_424896 [Rhodotorula toruloides]